MTEGAQAIVDLLDHFDFAKKITSVLIEVEHHPGQKYFIPCMLKNISQNNMQVRRKGHLQGALKKADTLHIMFSTKYVPPAFFFRLAACLTENKKYTLFKGGAYLNCISFCYNEIDRVPYQNQFLVQAFNLICCELLNGHHC